MNSWKPFTIPTKRSMLDDWQSSEYASTILVKLKTKFKSFKLRSFNIVLTLQTNLFFFQAKDF